MELFTSLDTLIFFVLASFAAFRVALFITKDKLVEAQREWLVALLVLTPEGGLRDRGLRYKLAYLLGCPFCVGIWVALAAVCVFTGHWPWAIGLDGLLLWLSIAGAQTTLQQWLYGRR